MSDDHINLADPDFEPTDAQLTGLSTRAFAGLRDARERAQRELREKVSRARDAALAALAARSTGAGSGGRVGG